MSVRNVPTCLKASQIEVLAGRCSTNVHIIQWCCNKLSRWDLIAFTPTVVIDVGQ